MSKQPAEKPNVWANWANTMTPGVRAALAAQEPHLLEPVDEGEPIDEEKVLDYAAFRARVSPSARDSMDDLVTAVPKETPNVTAARYVLMEGPDDALATATMFKTPEAMARRLGELEGKDTVAWCVYGIVMPFTRGPQRYLLMPDGVMSLQIPLYDGAPIARVEFDLLAGIEVQDDGYLGPPELVNPSIVEERLVRTKRSSIGDVEDDEIEDGGADDSVVDDDES